MKAEASDCRLAVSPVTADAVLACTRQKTTCVGRSNAFPFAIERENPADRPTRRHFPSTGAKKASAHEKRRVGQEGRMQAKTASATRSRHQEVRKLVDRLERGWAWFDANPDHPQFAAREDRWIAWLREYEAAFDAALGR